MTQSGIACKHNRTYEAAPDGEYLCRLNRIDRVKGKAYGSDERVDKLLFVFEALGAARESGEPYLFYHRCTPVYGPDRAKLTQLLDRIYGRRFTQDEWRRLDLGKLLGRHFTVLVSSRVGSDGRIYNDVVAVARATPTA